MLHAELPGTNRMHSGGRPGKIMSSCGGVRFPNESFLHRQRKTSDQREKEFAPTLEIEWNAQTESGGLCDREN